MRLGIDFGTSGTVAAGADTTVLPSGVCAAGDTLITGPEAAGRAGITPDAYEPHPKCRIGEPSARLGDFTFPIEKIIGAVLARAAEEATLASGDQVTALVLTHPASWSADRLQVLSAAARTAGLPAPELLPEPVAAARALAGVPIPGSGPILVYDLGAGGFSATVLSRGLDVLAAESLPDAGGLDVDNALLGWLAASIPAPDETWRRLLAPQTAGDRRTARRLRDDLRRVKEALSGSTSATLHVPLLDQNLLVTRQQLDLLARPVLDRTITAARAALRTAGLPTGAPVTVLMVGGASRMPLAGTLLHRALESVPVLLPDPELTIIKSIIQGYDSASGLPAAGVGRGGVAAAGLGAAGSGRPFGAVSGPPSAAGGGGAGVAGVAGDYGGPAVAGVVPVPEGPLGGVDGRAGSAPGGVATAPMPVVPRQASVSESPASGEPAAAYAESIAAHGAGPVSGAPASGIPLPASGTPGWSPASAPPASAPPASAPPASAPIVSAPLVSAPPASVPPASAPPAEQDRSAVAIRRWAIVAGAAAAVAAIAATAALLIPRNDDSTPAPAALPATTATDASGQGAVVTGGPQTSATASPAASASPSPATTSAAAAAPPSAATSAPAARSGTFSVPATLCPAVRYDAVTALVRERVSAPVRSGSDPTVPGLNTCQVDYASGGFQALAISLGSEAEGRDYLTSVRGFESSGGGIPNAKPTLVERDAAALGVGQEAFSFSSESPDGTRAGLVVRNGNLVMEFEIYGYDALVKDASKRVTITDAMARAVRETLPQLAVPGR
ncbi:Hsp70 family protein [Catenuloplanes sp. NPDC051500]|uniref:Hsp70 family protein n=1 Tax=Catenuloplanes sp. NPDC051500 TaxID=3363959 RepID=UPI0037989968